MVLIIYSCTGLYASVGKCKRESCKFRHLAEDKSHEMEKHASKLGKSNSRKPDDRCYQVSFEHKHYRNEYDDYGCECKRRRIRNHSPELSSRNCDTTDNRKLWVSKNSTELIPIDVPLYMSRFRYWKVKTKCCVKDYPN